MFSKYLAAIAITATLSTLGIAAHAQVNYPTKPVRLIVPFPAGQATDVVARLVADSLSKVWAQPVVVINQPGVPGMVAGRDAPLKDFAMVNAAAATPMIIVASPGLPYNTLKELIDAAKKSPGKFSIGYGGVYFKWGEAVRRANLKAD